MCICSWPAFAQLLFIAAFSFPKQHSAQKCSDPQSSSGTACKSCARGSALLLITSTGTACKCCGLRDLGPCMLTPSIIQLMCVSRDLLLSVRRRPESLLWDCRSHQLSDKREAGPGAGHQPELELRLLLERPSVARLALRTVTHTVERHGAVVACVMELLETKLHRPVRDPVECLLSRQSRTRTLMMSLQSLVRRRPRFLLSLRCRSMPRTNSISYYSMSLRPEVAHPREAASRWPRHLLSSQVLHGPHICCLFLSSTHNSDSHVFMLFSIHMQIYSQPGHSAVALPLSCETGLSGALMRP